MSIFTSLAAIIIVITLSFTVFKILHKKSHDVNVKRGVLSGLITGIIHIVFSCVVCALCEGSGFITYQETHEVINGISFNTVKTVGVCLASLVPIILCRFKDFKGYLKYIISSSLFFGMVYALEYISILIVFYISADIIFPLNTYDSLFFALRYFPIGCFLGTLIAVIVNVILNVLQKKRVG